MSHIELAQGDSRTISRRWWNIPPRIQKRINEKRMARGLPPIADHTKCEVPAYGPRRYSKADLARASAAGWKALGKAGYRAA